MTPRDEARAKCIEAIHYILERHMVYVPKPMAAEVFDSLHGAATVNLPEATGDMLDAAIIGDSSWTINALPRLRAAWRAMAAAGNLTNAPEKKP